MCRTESLLWEFTCLPYRPGTSECALIRIITTARPCASVGCVGLESVMTVRPCVSVGGWRLWEYNQQLSSASVNGVNVYSYPMHSVACVNEITDLLASTLPLVMTYGKERVPDPRPTRGAIDTRYTQSCNECCLHNIIKHDFGLWETPGAKPTSYSDRWGYVDTNVFRTFLAKLALLSYGLKPPSR